MKPNILFITADQWRGDSLGVAGHPVLRTPAIDRLAAEGTAFLRHYANAAPCSPARAVLYSGRYQMTNRVCRNGTPLDDRFDTIAKAARRAGYDPTLFGYTDTGADPRSRAPNDPALTTYESVMPGFTVRQGLDEAERPWISWLKRQGVEVSDPDLIHRPRDPAAPEVSSVPPAYAAEQTQTAFLTEAFLDWLGEQAPERPWFAHISFLRPHPPFVVPEPYASMYNPDEGPGFAALGSPDDEAALHPLVAFQMQTVSKDHFIPGAGGLVRDWSEAERRAIRAIYWGMIGEVDAQLGRIFDALKAAGTWDETVVLFTSDHAELMGDHHLFGKGGFFEGSYHIPLVVRMPGGTAGRAVESFTEAVDLFPTLCALMGTEPAEAVDGRSLVPFLTGDQPVRWRDHAFIEFDFRDVVGQMAEARFGLSSRECNLAILRDRDVKYVHFADLPPLLFDLAADPAETRNVADDPAYRDLRLHCAERLLAHRAAHLDQTLALSALTKDGVVWRREWPE
ncbi:alkaline phosphatase family protein [Amorphus sp. 3PC139-8]|uniref:alkaline phosphatase family protein n=1 Tax=Amorphus sp. 3PC139-8 TaxID=2735676 RepID=UPI00345D74D0